MKLTASILLTSALCFAPVAAFAKDKDNGSAPSDVKSGAEIAENADISIGINGLVCDFCSIALNKTFKKREEVLASYVDLDSKIMSVNLRPGKFISNEDIVTLVKKAGYSTTIILRKDGTDFIPQD